MALDSSAVRPEQILDIPSDARRVFSTLQAGGVAIIPVTVGYAVIATSPIALQKVFDTKQRKPHKRHAMVGSYDLHRSIHDLPPLQAGMVKLLAQDLNIPFAAIAPFRPDHPIIQSLGAETLAKSSVDGTIAILMNGGVLQDELARLAMEAGVPLMGSSANLTGRGTKRCVEDIEPEIIAAADVVIDYGCQPHVYPRTSSSMFDFKNMRVVRFGACYHVIQDAFRRWYGIRLPDDPGREALFSGHVGQEANQY
ncbi:hypothetical protein FE257_011326 [Aspergillus nanangensis]|uniref:Threonylcarbamoyl-AMP synthase n=1 Tax=Aspergillus nanangensis TaxID=2582783 RepID=A0AAD4CHG2_ASPNN|nr:hypothetical protein FE257_011326 [Aspergillus nanangensis]